eukprot:COSAG02_NODE_595_length_19813_cov_12.215380_18_plen_210_part_00
MAMTFDSAWGCTVSSYQAAAGCKASRCNESDAESMKLVTTCATETSRDVQQTEQGVTSSCGSSEHRPSRDSSAQAVVSADEPQFAVVPPPPPIQGPGPVVCGDSSGDDDELGIVKVKCGAEDHGPLGIVFQEVSIKSVDPSGMGQFRAGRPLERGMLLRAINDVPADRLAFNAYAPTLILPFSLSSRSSLSDLCPPLQSRALYNRLYGS